VGGWHRERGYVPDATASRPTHNAAPVPRLVWQPSCVAPNVPFVVTLADFGEELKGAGMQSQKCDSFLSHLSLRAPTSSSVAHLFEMKVRRPYDHLRVPGTVLVQAKRRFLKGDIMIEPKHVTTPSIMDIAIGEVPPEGHPDRPGYLAVQSEGSTACWSPQHTTTSDIIPCQQPF